MIWKKYIWKTKICQKYSNNKVIPASIHHAKNINITTFVVYIYNTHFFFVSFVYFVYTLMMCVVLWQLKLTRSFQSSFFVLNSNQFCNESLKKRLKREKINKKNLLFLLISWLKNIFHSNVKIVIAFKTSYNMEYFSR